MNEEGFGVSQLSLESLPKVEWIQYFIVVAQEKSMMKASSQLGISTQALHQSLAKLETKVGCPLMEWSGQSQRLTPQGELFLEKAYTLLQHLHQIPYLFKEQAPQEVAKIYIAHTALWKYFMLPSLLKDFISTTPIHLQITQLSTEEIEQMLLSGSLSLGLTFRVPLETTLQCYQGAPIPLRIVSSPQPYRHWSDFSYIAIRSLFVERQLFKSWDDSKYRTHIIAETDSAQQALDLCKQGLCAAVVPEIMVQEDLQAGLLSVVAELPEPNFVYPCVIYNSQYEMSSGGKELFKQIQDHLHKR